jgi:hypothetical protein
MNTYLLLASLLALLVGLIHSFLGEKLIFSSLRADKIVPTKVSPPLKERHIRIIWASWHIVTFFGFGFSALLYWMALPSTTLEITLSIKLAIAIPMLLSALLVLSATKGKHPGWAGLLLIGILICLS